MGRLRLPTPERKLRKRQSQERWKDKNRDYYLEQKRRLASRPEYREKLAHRYLEQKIQHRRKTISSLMNIILEDVDFSRPMLRSSNEQKDLSLET